MLLYDSNANHFSTKATFGSRRYLIKVWQAISLETLVNSIAIFWKFLLKIKDLDYSIFSIVLNHAIDNSPIPKELAQISHNRKIDSVENYEF